MLGGTIDVSFSFCSPECLQSSFKPLQYSEQSLDALEDLQNKFPEMDSILNGSNKPFPHIYFLGTASSQVTKYRGTSAILLQTR